MKRLTKNNKNCLLLFEAQTGDSTIAGNRGRSMVNGRLLSSPAPTLDTSIKAYGSQSWAFDSASSEYFKSWRGLSLTIASVTANNTFTISSSTNYTSYFIANKIISISGATNNNGTFHVTSSSFASNVTTVIISETTLVTGGTLGTVGHTNPWAAIGTGNFTAEAVFTTPSSWPDSYHDIFGWDYSTMFSLEVIASYPKLVLWINSTTKTLVNPIAANTTYHVLIVRNNAVLKIWVNGVLVSYTSSETTSLTANNDFFIGSDGTNAPDGITYFKGNIQRVGLWNDVLYWTPRITTGKTHFNSSLLLKNYGSTPNQ